MAELGINIKEEQVRSHLLEPEEIGYIAFDAASARAVITEHGDILVHAHFWVKRNFQAMESFNKAIREQMLPQDLKIEKDLSELEIKNSKDALDALMRYSWFFLKEFQEEDYSDIDLLAEIISKIDPKDLLNTEGISWDEKLRLFVSDKDENGLGIHLGRFLAQLNSIQQLTTGLYLLLCPEYNTAAAKGKSIGYKKLEDSIVRLYYKMSRHLREVAKEEFGDIAVFNPLQKEMGYWFNRVNRAIRNKNALELNGATIDAIEKRIGKNISFIERMNLRKMYSAYGDKAWAYDVLQLSEMLSEDHFTAVARKLKTEEPPVVLPSEKPNEVFDATGHIATLGLALRVSSDLNLLDKDPGYKGKYMIRTSRIKAEGGKDKLDAARDTFERMFKHVVLENAELTIKTEDGKALPIHVLMEKGRLVFEKGDKVVEAMQDSQVKEPIKAVYPVKMFLDGEDVGTLYLLDTAEFIEKMKPLNREQDNIPRPCIVKDGDEEIFFSLMTDATPGGVWIGDGLVEQLLTPDDYEKITAWQIAATQILPESGRSTLKRFISILTDISKGDGISTLDKNKVEEFILAINVRINRGEKLKDILPQAVEAMEFIKALENRSVTDEEIKTRLLGGEKEELLRFEEFLSNIEETRILNGDTFIYLKAQIAKKLLLPLGGGVHFLGRHVHKLPTVFDTGAHYLTPTSCSTNGASHLTLMLSVMFGGFGMGGLISSLGTTLHMYTSDGQKGPFGHVFPKGTGAAEGVKRHFLVIAIYTALRTAVELIDGKPNVVGGSGFDFLKDFPYGVQEEVLKKYVKRISAEFPEVLKVYEPETDQDEHGRYTWKDTISGKQGGSMTLLDYIEQITESIVRMPSLYDNEMSFSYEMNRLLLSMFSAVKRQIDIRERERILAQKPNFVVKEIEAKNTQTLGKDTIRVESELAGGARGHFVVPAGTSTGKGEAETVGVTKAKENVKKIAAMIDKERLSADQIDKIGQLMLEMGKDELGAEATLGVQTSLAWASAEQSGLTPDEFIEKIAPDLAPEKVPQTKIQYNITNGGEHAKNSLDMQEFMIITHGKTTADENRMCDEIDRKLGEIYKALGLKANPDDKGVGDLRGKEGGYKVEDLTTEKLNEIYANAAGYDISNLDIEELAKPESNVGVHEFVLHCMVAAIRNAGYTPSDSGEVNTVGIALDPAVSEMYGAKRAENENLTPEEREDAAKHPNEYWYEGEWITSAELTSIYEDWVEKFPIISIEDGMAEKDWDGWMNHIDKLGDKILLIGDDNLVTQAELLLKLYNMVKERGWVDENGKVTKKLGILIKLNQNGFLTTGISDTEEGYLGTIEVIRLAKKLGFQHVVSHRSKEAEPEENEVSIAYLAAATNAVYLKSGNHVQGIRAVKEDTLAAIIARRVKKLQKGKGKIMEVSTIEELAKSKKQINSVIVGVDWNVSMDQGQVVDDSRIRETVPTFRKVIETTGAKNLFTMSHLGRPKGKGFEGEYTMAPVVERAREVFKEEGLDIKIVILPYDQSAAKHRIREVRQDNPDDTILFVFENIRFYPDEKSEYAMKRSSFEKWIQEVTQADAYVCEAFGKVHRGEDASMELVNLFEPEQRAAGIMLEEEIDKLIKFEESVTGRLVAVFGGAKFDKFKTIGILSGKIAKKGGSIAIIGALANAYLAVKGQNMTGAKLPKHAKEWSAVKKGIEAIEKSGVKVILPEVDDLISSGNVGKYIDIGPKTQKIITNLIGSLDKGDGLIMNGGAGVFEKEEGAAGTDKLIADANEAVERGVSVFAAGMDMNKAISNYEERKNTKVSSKMIRSTGGGSLLTALAKGVMALSPIAALVKGIAREELTLVDKGETITPQIIIENAEEVVNGLVNALTMVSRKDEKVVLALDTELGEGEINKLLQDLMANVDELKKNNEDLARLLRNLIVIRGEGKELSDRLQNEDLKSVKKENFIIIAKSENVENNFKKLKGISTIAAIDDSKLSETDYIPLLEIVYFAAGKYFGWSESKLKQIYSLIPNVKTPNPSNKEFYRLFNEDSRDFLFRIIPNAAKFDKEELRTLIKKLRSIMVKA